MTESWEFGHHTERTAERTPPTFPWPPPEDGPILAAFGEAWKGATFDPGRFFARTPRQGGTGAAVIYYLAIGILVAGATLFWETMPFLTGSMAEDPIAQLGYGAIHPLVRFLLAPAVLLAALVISAGVVHVLLLLFNGANHGFGTTLRVFCYGYSPAIFGIVPILGALVGSVWAVVVVIIGLREAHEADSWKAVLAVLIPFVSAMILMFLGMLAVFMTAEGGLLPAP